MYVVKAFVDLVWIVVKMCPTKDDAEMYQDSLWLNMPEVITEVEFRGFN